jgi:hypothetical protein
MTDVSPAGQNQAMAAIIVQGGNTVVPAFLALKRFGLER